MDEVSEMVGEAVDIEEPMKEDMREVVLRGGLKISLANSSCCIPKTLAALIAAAGFMNLSVTRPLPE